jgi:hypothetical protein
MKPIQRFFAYLLLTNLFTSGSPHAAHPGPQPNPGASLQTKEDNKTTVVTPHAIFPQQDPFAGEPANRLPTVYNNLRDKFGTEMPNTLPSSDPAPVAAGKAQAYNLHAAPVQMEAIDKTSPTDDLLGIFALLGNQNTGEAQARQALQQAVDILEGNPLPYRVYSGFPLLHYKGPEKLKKVRPVFDANGAKIGGEVTIRQIWYDNHIESDTALLDPSDVLNVPWIITYVVDVLDKGEDDFAPLVMYFDADPFMEMGKPHISMEQTFYPMREGRRHTFRIKMSLGKYYNLTYTWGWRFHPPRAQVSENARKSSTALVGGRYTTKTLHHWETSVFGDAPSGSEAAKLAAIAKIGALAPEKRLWTAFRQALAEPRERWPALLDEAEAAFADWRDRTHLPRGVKPDPDADVTLFYVNNTIYGQSRIAPSGTGFTDFPQWRLRGARYKVRLLNGDHFEHGYANVDFGGLRGWENQFQAAVAEGGVGHHFGFGRFHWWLNAGEMWGPITVPPAVSPTEPGSYLVDITFNHEPSPRLRMYQFDPLHHDVGIFSLH